MKVGKEHYFTFKETDLEQVSESLRQALLSYEPLRAICINGYVIHKKNVKGIQCLKDKVEIITKDMVYTYNYPIQPEDYNIYAKKFFSLLNNPKTAIYSIEELFILSISQKDYENFYKNDYTEYLRNKVLI